MGSRPMVYMKTTIAKIVGPSLALLLLGSICIPGVRAQQASRSSSPPAVTTNWMGYLVAGQSDTSDRITPSPSPSIVRQVEIGLRSDGVVIWREATRTK
jgi:hypothetical protein